jgi:hypothetical protein
VTTPHTRAAYCTHLEIIALWRRTPELAHPNEGGEEELEKLLDYLLKVVPPAVEDFFGIKVRTVKLSKANRKKLLVQLKALVSGAKVLESIKPPFATKAEWVTALDTLDQAMKPFLDPPARRMHLADYLRHGYLELIDAPLEVRYLSKTSYKAYCREVESVASEIFKNQRQAYADQLFFGFSQNPDSGILTQALLVQVPRIMNYLAVPRRNFTKLTLDRILRFYLELSGYYEKSLRLIIGMLEVLEGKEPNYSSLCRQSLAANLSKVNASHKVLAADFNIIVRNSMAHGSHYFHYGSKTIDFHDRNGKRVTWDFLEMSKQCRTMSALAMATMMAYFVFQARRWQNIWDAYCAEKSEDRIA